MTSDQPFDEVENPFLRRLLQYTHGRGRTLQIPGRSTVRRRVMEMGDEVKNELKAFFKVVYFNTSHMDYLSKHSF